MSSFRFKNLLSSTRLLKQFVQGYLFSLRIDFADRGFTRATPSVIRIGGCGGESTCGTETQKHTKLGNWELIHIYNCIMWVANCYEY